MGAARKHTTQLVGPSKWEDCPAGCGDQIAWVTYVPAPQNRQRGRELSRLPLDVPAIVPGSQHLPVDHLKQLGVSHVTTASLLSCRLLDDDLGLLTHENGHSIHYATHPACRAALTTPGSNR